MKDNKCVSENDSDFDDDSSNGDTDDKSTSDDRYLSNDDNDGSVDCTFNKRKRKKLSKTRTKKKIMVHQCDICDYKFNSEAEINSHNFIAHNINYDLNDQKYKCLLCSKIFSAKSCLDSHVTQVHTEKKVINCVKCNKIFKYRSYLTSNKMKSVSNVSKNNKTFTCFHCSSKKNVHNANGLIMVQALGNVNQFE